MNILLIFLQVFLNTNMLRSLLCRCLFSKVFHSVKEWGDSPSSTSSSEGGGGGERGAGTGNCVSGKFFTGCLGPEED